MTNNIVRKTPGLAAASLTLLIAGSIVSPAAAAPPPASPSPTQCLGAFDHDEDYVGNGWPSAPVYRAYGEEGTVNLLCGDELSGVVHTAHPASTGNTHPVSPGQDEYSFQACFAETISEGTSSKQGDGRVRYVMKNALSGVTSTAIIDPVRRFTYTVFTDSAPSGNDWLGCSVQGSR